MTNFIVHPSQTLQGSLSIPGDKSISHRSIIFASLAKGQSHITGFLNGDDCLATLKAFQAMGVAIRQPSPTEVIIQGVGKHGLQAPAHALDLGNSGTSMRLLSGLLATQAFASQLIGDKSLNKRPMGRVTKPLTQMGCHISTEQGHAPINIKPAPQLQGIDYKMPIASAQVKSCLLLAGLYAQGQTCVTEPAPTRDHTERMLQSFGYPIQQQDNKVCVNSNHQLQACDLTIPADISSATFFLIGASIAKQSDLYLPQIGINPTRTGVIEILQQMGANIRLNHTRQLGGEPVADIHIQAAKLKGIRIEERLVPLAIDEFPAIFVAAACAEGETILTAAKELRVKESDRIQVMADGLQNLGINAQATEDGMIIQGGQIQGGTVESHGDHRIAMAFAMAAYASQASITITDCDNVNTSFPSFVSLATMAGLKLETIENK